MKKLGERLIEAGIITRAQLDQALVRQRDLDKKPKPIGEILIEMGLIDIETLLSFLEEQLKERLTNN